MIGWGLVIPTSVGCTRLGELGILLGGFRESQAVQLRVDLNRLHVIIISSRV